MTDNPMDWVAVAAVPGIGAITCQRLLQADWTPSRLLSANDEQWHWLGLKPRARQALQAYQNGQGPLHQAIGQVRQWLDRYPDAHLLTLGGDGYPALLKAIADPPPILLLRGDPSVLHWPQVAVVGSRNASRTGCDHAQSFSRVLAASGLVITSGMAYGIDSAAHKAAADQQLPTVAVFGTGPDKLYPARNSLLAQQILETGGCWLSELLPGTPPLAQHFPRRNRIISGLSAGVLVVEAAPRSGSLITARLALEQGREVFAIPGALNNPMSHGCHTLIREGAVLVQSVQDIVDQLGALLGSYLPAPAPPVAAADPLPELAAGERAVLDAMGYELISLEQLLQVTGLQVPELSRQLVVLELKGCIEAAGSGYLRLK